MRWLLIVSAFVGALMVIKPGADSFQRSTLLALTTLGFNVAFHLVTSRLARLDQAGTMHLYTGLVGAALAAIALPFSGAGAASTIPWLAIALICILSSAGHLMLILGYSKAGVATLTPLLYVQVVFGTLLGWLVFAHVPDGWSMTGISAIAFCGAGCAWLSTRARN